MLNRSISEATCWTADWIDIRISIRFGNSFERKECLFMPLHLLRNAMSASIAREWLRPDKKHGPLVRKMFEEHTPGGERGARY